MFTSTAALERALPRKPELLAPAGDRTCLIAAVENGADAVYFGLQRHNARIRAAIRRGATARGDGAACIGAGCKGYITLNTLVFPASWPSSKATVRELATAGVDAVIVQDLGLGPADPARSRRPRNPRVDPDVDHQRGESRWRRELGCSRVILARELSLDRDRPDPQANRLAGRGVRPRRTLRGLLGPVPDQRGAGRPLGEPRRVRQACRMPYEIVCDGRLVDLDNIQYLLSPQDLAAYDLIPRLIELGVASLKIEGRLKTPEYVANITRHYRTGDRRRLGRPAGRLHPARRPGDAALVLPRLFATAFWTATTTRCWCAATMPRSAGSSSARWNRSVTRRRSLDRARLHQAGRWRRVRRRRIDRPGPNRAGAFTSDSTGGCAERGDEPDDGNGERAGPARAAIRAR